MAGGPNNLSIKNRYESPHRTVIGKKTWVDGELANNGVRPTIWLKPERSLDGNTWEAVPGTAPVAVTHPDTKAVWDNVDEFDNNGVPYQFRVLEVDSAGNDWKPDNYDKIGAGTNMTNPLLAAGARHRAAERDADPWRAGDILAMGRDSGRPCGAGRLSVRGTAAGSVPLYPLEITEIPRS